MGGEDLTPGLLSLGVSSDGFSIRLGMLYSTIINRSETPVTIEECLALDLEGVRGLVADSKIYCKRTLALCRERCVGLITLVPRPCVVCQE
jgi:hypothetical protein